MKDSNRQYSHFNRHRQYLNKWLQQVYPPSPTPTPISTQPLCTHLFQQLLQSQPQSLPKPRPKVQPPLAKIQQNNDHRQLSPISPISPMQQMQSFVSVEELWDRNQNFMQCLKDFCEDLLYYVFVGDSLRVSMPVCLIGYYQLVKNLLCIHHHDVKLEGKGVLVYHKPIPKQFQQFAKQKMIRILVSECPYNYIRINLTKLQQQSPITQNFRKQLSLLLISRFIYMCRLYSLSLHQQCKATTKLSQYFLSELLQNFNQDTNISVSIDLIILCIIYSVYRINRYLILFSNIINIYEKQCQFPVDREKLLDFYNTEFIIKLLPTSLIQMITIVETVKKEGDAGYDLGLPNRAEDVMKNSGVGACLNSFQSDQIKEEKSLYDMFQ